MIVWTSLHRFRSLIWNLCFFCFLIIYQNTTAQNLKERSGVRYIPVYNTKVNGIAGGLIINGLREPNDSTVSTIVNGLSIELLGLGLLLPIVPSSPIYTDADSLYNSEVFVDSVVESYNSPRYIINGLLLSPGGVAGYDVEVNGANISGLNTLTSKVNGISTSIMFHISGIVNGVAIGGIANSAIQIKGLQISIFNEAIKVQGLQIGLFNSTKFLKGVQIGLWNKNSRRRLPIINWN